MYKQLRVYAVADTIFSILSTDGLAHENCSHCYCMHKAITDFPKL